MTNVISVLGVNKEYVVIPSQYKCQQGWIEIVVSIPAVYMSCMSYVTYVICLPRAKIGDFGKFREFSLNFKKAED